MNYTSRTERVKRKHGKNCFSTWGKRGGSPILKAYKEGRVTIHKRRA